MLVSGNPAQFSCHILAETALLLQQTKPGSVVFTSAKLRHASFMELPRSERFLLLLRICSAHLGIFGFLKEYNNFFRAVYDYVEKADPSKGYQNPKRKLGVNTHSSEIIELKFGKKLPYILCILTLLEIYGLLNYL